MIQEMNEANNDCTVIKKIDLRGEASWVKDGLSLGEYQSVSYRGEEKR